MIELDSLKFTVDTGELVSAVQDIQKLQNAVTNLNKPLAENARISAKAAKEAAAVAQAEAKTAVSIAKVEEAQNKSNLAKARAEKAIERLTGATKQQTTVLEKNQNIYEFMLQGYSKGQATTLAAAKAQGALADEIAQVGKVLQDQRKLMGGDPFDKSIQGLISLQNSLVDMDHENRMVAQGIQLTSKQYKELARDLQRITETSLSTGDSFEVMAAKLNAHKQKFIEVATSINQLTEVEKERERNQRLQANAIRAIAAEDEKMESILRSLNLAQTEHVSVSEKAARSIANYERNLRLAGVTGEQAAAKLDKFRKSALMAAQAEEKRKVDMLSRALAPQISDVVVSLGSGMNPMTVLLQQGLQVRDLIGLSGVAVNDLQKAFKSAASDMVSSLKGTAVALGSLLIGGLIDAGKAVLNFGVNITGTNLILEKLRTTMVGFVGENSKLVKSFDVIGKIMVGVAGTGVAALATGFISYLVALKQVVSEQNSLVRNLALTGASLGLNKDQAIALANSLDGISESKATAVLSEMAKVGGFTKEQFEAVTLAAVKLEKYADIAFEETVKNFAKLQDSPSKSLAEFATKNGLVEISVIKQVKALEQQKRFVEATDLAIKEYSKSQVAAAAIMEDSLHPITKVWIDIKEAIGDAWEAIKEFARSDVVVEPFRIAFEFVRNIIYDVWLAVKAIGGTIATIIAVAEQLVTGGGISGAAAVVKAAKEDFKDGLAARAKFMSDMSKPVPTGTDRSKNANAAADWLRQQKKDGQNEAAKERERIAKAQIRDIEKFNDLLEVSQKKKENLTQAERIYNDLVSSEDWSKKSAEQRKEIETLRDKAKAEELVARELKKRLEIEDLIYESRSAAEQLNFRDIESSREIVVGLIAENENIKEQIGLIGAESLATEELAKKKLRKVIAEKQEYLMAIKNSGASEEKIYLLEREIDLLTEQVGLIDEKVNKESFVKMRNSISDAIVTGLFEGGKAGSEKLRSIIEAELRKPITVFIQAVVSDVMGMNGPSGVGSFANTISKGTDILKNMMNFGSNLSSSIGTSALRIGDWLATSSNNSLASVGEFLQKNFSGIGKIGGAVGNAFAGNTIYKGLSNGYSISKGLDMVGNIASLFGPIYGAIGGVINRAFGRKLKDTGIEGTFSGGDNFSGSSYQFYKGGLLRSDKTKYSELDSGVQSALGEAFGQITKSTLSMVKTLGLNSNALDNFSYGVKFSTNGMDEKQVQAKLLEVLGTVAEEQAKHLLGTFTTETKNVKGGGLFGRNRTISTTTWTPGEFVKYGESASEALVRLSSSLSSVNSFLEKTNVNLLQVSLVGADTASKLVDLFGSLDSFNTASSSYYENFFSDQEKLTKGNEYLKKAFSDLNIALPTSIENYRKLVESQDLTTSSGRETFTALLSLSSAFYELNKASEAAVSTILEEVTRLRNASATDSFGGFDATKASFISALALAKSGDKSALDSLPGMSQSLEDMFKNRAGSLQELNSFRAWLANSLSSSVPAFATGGIHSGGVRLVGEDGPELEVTGPSRIFNSSDTMSMLSSEGVIKAVGVLNENLSMLREEVRADVIHNAKTAKLLDRVIPDGNSVAISGSIDGGLIQ